MRGILGPWSAVRVGLGLLAAVPRLAADPLQIEHPAFGGQVVPARAVPVDMVSEVLEATMVPRPAPTKATLGPPTPCEARVRVEYHLRADQTLAVPILFPSFGPMEAVSIRLNEDAVAVQIRDDVVVLQPYEAAWRAVIDHAVAGDARLRSAAAEARESRRRLHEQPPPPRRAGGPPRPQMDTWTFSRLMPALNRWWRARGVPEKEAQALSWSLAHHVLDDWPELAVWPTHGVAEAKRVSDRIRLWSERRLATHLDAKTPDPVALWQGLEPNPELQPMSFVAGSLRLRQGDNTLLVEYRQPVSTVNRPAPPSPKRYGSHIQLPQFGFILRTARYWRSFGQFSVDLRLPAGTRWAECSLPGAAVQTRADPPRVSYRGTGLPAENLTVVFGAEAPGPVPTAPERRGAGSAPTVKLSVLWEVTVTRGSGFGHAVPVVDAEHVVAGAGREGVILQRASGRLLRRFSTDDDVASLLLDGGSLFVGGNVWARNGKREGISVVACYDVVTGQRRWRTELPAQEEVSGGPKLRKLGQLVLGSAGAVFALAATDGAVRWQQPFATTGVALSPEAAAGRPDGLAYVAGRPGRQRFRNGRPCDPGCVLALRADTGEERWRCEVGGEVSGVLLDGPRLVVTVGPLMDAKPELVAIDTTDGRLRWRRATGVRYGFMEVEAIRRQDDGLLVVSSTEASLYAPEQGRRVWTVDFGGQTRSEPAIRGTELFLSNYQGIGCLDLRARAFSWHYPEQGSSEAITVGGDELYALQIIGGGLTAYRLPQAGTTHASASAAAARPSADPPDSTPDRRSGRRLWPAGLLSAGILFALWCLRRRRAPRAAVASRRGPP